MAIDQRMGEMQGLHDAGWNNSLLIALGLTGRAIKMAFEAYLGITEARLRLLALLYTEHELSQSDLQRRLEVDGAAITRQVKQMEAEGLLTRRPHPADNRYTLVAPTPAGLALFESLVSKARAFEALAIQGIDPEAVACFRRVLTSVRSNLCGFADGEDCAVGNELTGTG